MKKRNKFVVVDEDFETLCINAIRYCMGRQSYMPSLTIGIIKPYVKEFSDKCLKIMINDCETQCELNFFGDEKIDKPMWIDWFNFLLSERKQRTIDDIVKCLIERDLPKDIDVYFNQTWFKDYKYCIYNRHNVEINYCEEKNYIEIYGIGISDDMSEILINQYNELKGE